MLTTRNLRWLGIAILVANAIPSASAQFERYEVGRRLREFENAWDRQPREESVRSQVSRNLQSAVKGFFGGRMPEAARSVTEAFLSLGLADPPATPSSRRWAASLCLKPETRWLDREAHDLAITIDAFYPSETPPVAGASIRLTLGTAGSLDAAISDLPMTVRLPLAGLVEGDHELLAVVRQDGQVLATIRQTISVAENRDDRLARIKTKVSAWDANATPTADRASAREGLARIQTLASGRTLESDFPATKILIDLEDQIAAIEMDRPYLGKDRAGQFWVSLPRRNGGTVATRIFVPEAASGGKPLPIVIALHGAGGSENMFFESYGHGAIVDLCKARGWLLVAPRGAFFASMPTHELVDELAKIYPIDLGRVMLVGHSMGAAQAVGAAQVAPSRFAAVAALGGGGAVRAVPNLEKVPFFVGIGADDFARDGAKRLAASLNRANVATVNFREYPHVEHLAIVQVALPDVFRFFDEVLKR